MSQSFEQFGKYILLEKLAAGGMAEVYFAKSTGAVGVSKFIAIKRILPQFSENPEFVEMFKEEAKLAVNLNHSNVVSIFDFGVERGQFYIVMDYVEGKNLRQFNNELKKQNKALSIEDVVFIIKEAAAGLDHAHRCVDAQTGKPLNIIHRDISPQNIMVSYEGEIKLIDFGIAKAETQMEATKAGTLKGKFGYMSPEQVEGQAIDSRTDVFSLGIVLWEMLANERLFAASNEAAILNKIRSCQIPPIRKLCPNVPPELEKIVNKALAKDKGLRYESAAAFHRDLNRFLNVAYPEFSPQEFSRTMKNSFADEFLAVQKKRIEYAKVQLNTNEDKTVVANTVTDYRPTPKNVVESTVIEEAERPDIELNTSTNLKVDLSSIQSGKKTGIRSDTVKTKTSIGQTGIQQGSGTGIYSNTSYRPAASSSGGNWLSPAILLLIVGAGGYFAFSQGYLDKFIKTKAPVARAPMAPSPSSPDKSMAPPANLPQPVEERTELSSTAGTSEIPTRIRLISLRSTPTGASVYINNVLQDGRTPSQYQVPAMQDSPSYMTVVKEGFSPVTLTFKPTDKIGLNEGASMSVVLEPEVFRKVVFANSLPYEVKIRVTNLKNASSPALSFEMKVGQKAVYELPVGSYEVKAASDIFGETTLKRLEVVKPIKSTDETFYQVTE